MRKDQIDNQALIAAGLRQPMLDNALLTAFLAVVDCGSYTSAAKFLHRTQSAVSLQIRRLEESLNTQLFEFPRNHVVLSQNGLAFVEYARRLVALNREALASVDEGAMRGQIRIGSNNFYASNVLPPLLVEFSAMYPDVQLILTTGGQSTLAEGLGNRFDLIFNFYRETDCRGQILSRETLHWVEAPDQHIWRKDPVPVALMPKESLLREIMIESLGQLGRNWRMVYESHSLDATISAVAAGLAVTICVSSRLNLAGDTLCVLGKDAAASLPECVFAVERASGPTARPVIEFYNFMIQRLGTHDLAFP
ncbi:MULTISPECIES: LysR substrate-binding domain-containing protein [unclassified Shinella]|uniref:LysR substrate-binding domain-containing protein n=1 Tax=unclassified Shinella TaxID=2643062 RepID=UPI00225D7B06|nr:LysR substrate-binding domain-containing protein [Shinella sp. YE25]MDC7259686.1 LysR family transcriptional regulator [Shinella sp. YE25]CAI0334107.1 LysR family transcriptional regulator [Rhizobiaceae bacterium]CAK7261760.1 LysR family transcriptional regulator [Shinella sp. WSC3-e]